MANTSLKVTNFSKALLYHLDKTLVYQKITNRTYQGDARLGNTVRINNIGSTVVGTYTPGSDFSILPVTSSYQDLLIDQFKYTATSIDQVDLAQTNVDTINAIMKDASYQLEQDVDSYIASLYTTMSTGSNLGNDDVPLIATGSSAYQYLTKAALYLDKNNVPRGDRYIVVPFEFAHELENDGVFKSDPNILANGLQSEKPVAGFTLYCSNNVPNTAGAKYKCMFGHRPAIASVAQMQEMEMIKLEKQFGYLVKGLYVYGAKVINPKGCGVMTVSFA